MLTPASIWGEDEDRDFLDWDTEVRAVPRVLFWLWCLSIGQCGHSL